MRIFDQGNASQQGGSRKGRLILAAIIAVFALISYMSSTQVNPVTGEKQHLTISPDQEIKLGLESAPEMAKEMGGERDRWKCSKLTLTPTFAPNKSENIFNKTPLLPTSPKVPSFNIFLVTNRKPQSTQTRL